MYKNSQNMRCVAYRVTSLGWWVVGCCVMRERIVLLMVSGGEVILVILDYITEVGHLVSSYLVEEEWFSYWNY